MKKNLFEIIIVIFIVIEVILSTFNYINKYEISRMLEINNINDFSIKGMRGSSFSQGSEMPIFIKFKISSDKYEKYNLQYQDVTSDDYIYEGEITNKKQKIDDNYYMCYYESVIYDKKEKEEFKKMKKIKFFLKVNSIVLIPLLFIYAIKKMIAKKL